MGRVLPQPSTTEHFPACMEQSLDNQRKRLIARFSSLIYHGTDRRTRAALVHEFTHLHPLVPGAFVLNLIEPPLQVSLSLLNLLKLFPQCRFRLPRGLLALLELADAVTEQVIDELHLGNTSLERSVLRSKCFIR